MNYHFSRNALRIFLAATLAALTLSSAQAQRMHTPRPGSSERSAIMDAIRPTCERDLQQPVIFKVTLLNVAGDWAAARVMPIKPNGNEIDFSKTHYREDYADGSFDSVGEALLPASGRRMDAGEMALWRDRHRALDVARRIRPFLFLGRSD